MSDYDVVICGAGPAGLTLAAALGRQGRRVLVVEKQHETADVFKGEILQPRSQVILDELGLLVPLQATAGVRAGTLECLDARGIPLMELDYGRLDSPYNHLSVHYYRDIQQAFETRLGERVEVMRGAKVTELLRSPSGRINGVRAYRDRRYFTVSARLVVGCEGEASVCRSQAGLSRGRVRRYGHDLLGFDIHNPPPLPSRLTAYVTREGLRLVYPMPRGRARLYVQIPSGGARDIRRAGLADWLSTLARSTPPLRDVVEAVRENPGSAQPLPARRWTAPAWSVPGMAVAGDAAHGVHPMAGQGMNAAIADVRALSECLAAVPDLAASGLVDRALWAYEGRRRPELACVARMSHSLAVAFTQTSGPVQALSRRLMRGSADNHRMKDILVLNMSGLGPQPFTLRDRLYQLGTLRDPDGSTGYPRPPADGIGRRPVPGSVAP